MLYVMQVDDKFRDAIQKAGKGVVRSDHFNIASLPEAWRKLVRELCRYPDLALVPPDKPLTIFTNLALPVKNVQPKLKLVEKAEPQPLAKVFLPYFSPSSPVHVQFPV